MIPETKKDLVQKALLAAFGQSEYEAITELTAGLSSALIYRIKVQGKPYLLRIIVRSDAMGDPSHHFTCMQPAALAGIAPQVRYTSIEDRIAITDYIEPKPFPVAQARILLPGLLKRLHSLPLFPARLKYLVFIDNTLRKIQAVKMLPEHLTAPLFAHYERIIKVYPRNEAQYVSCHNDLKPDNILFDGQRAWLVDWEAAFLNDRYFDLAYVANFLVDTPEQENDLLQRYFGKQASPAEQARFFLARQLFHMICFSFFLSLATADGQAPDLASPVPGYREFHDRLWEGKIYLLDKQAQLQYARVHMEKLQENLRLPRLEESLNLVANTHSHYTG